MKGDIIPLTLRILDKLNLMSNIIKKKLTCTIYRYPEKLVKVKFLLD